MNCNEAAASETKSDVAAFFLDLETKQKVRSESQPQKQVQKDSESTLKGRGGIMNTENRNIRFTSTVICRIFLGICCCFLAACSSQSSQNNSNIFLYAVDFSHSTLSPGNVKFDMSMEDVLQTTQLSEDDVDTTLGEAYPRIIHSISISGLSDDIREIFSFQNDQLVSVEYAITVPESEFQTILQTLAHQAAELPEDLLVGENQISDEKTTRWEDEQKNSLILSFPETDTSEERVIFLGLYRTKA